MGMAPTYGVQLRQASIGFDRSRSGRQRWLAARASVVHNIWTTEKSVIKIIYK
jgi:hypothetical protein